MYRTFAPLFLLSTIMAAPQDAAITYVKIQPITDELTAAPSYRASRIENIPLTIPGSSEKEIEDAILDTSEDNENRNVRAEPTTEDYDTETTEPATERYEAKTTLSELKTTVYEPKTTVYEPKTTVYEPKTKVYAPRPKAPKFYSKLSYFEKSNDFSSVSTNLVDRSGRRKFKSKCRCEKISNCPKLQITVPRCPEDQFLCCF